MGQATNVENFSAMSPSTIFTAPISMMRSIFPIAVDYSVPSFPGRTRRRYYFSGRQLFRLIEKSRLRIVDIRLGKNGVIGFGNGSSLSRLGKESFGLSAVIDSLGSIGNAAVIRFVRAAEHHPNPPSSTRGSYRRSPFWESK